MTLRLGFDLDGVVADMAGAVDREAAAAFEATPEETGGGEAVAPEGAAAAASPGGEAGMDLGRTLTRRQQRDLWRRIRKIENFWESLDETEPGLVARLWALAEERRWEVIFLTKRPQTAGRTAQLQSHRWLQRHGFQCPSIFVVQGSRGKIAAALDLDVVVDDTPDNCVDVLAESPAKAILVVRESDQRLAPSAQRLGIGVVRSVNECLDVLARTAEQDRGRVGVLARLTSLLGIRTDTRPTGASRSLADV